VSKLAEDQPALNRSLLAHVRQLSQQDSTYGDKVLRFLAASLRPYIPPEAFDSHEAYVQHLRAVDTRTLGGKRVKSQEEVAIANFLTLQGITYAYEAPYVVDTATPTHTQYRPDCYLPDADLYIEHFAVDEQGRTPPFIDQAEYTAGMAWKRHTHLKYYTTLIETYSYQCRDGSLFDALAHQLRAYAVVFQPQSLEEVLARQADQRRIET
jgi:DNA helicase-4